MLYKVVPLMCAGLLILCVLNVCTVDARYGNWTAEMRDKWTKFKLSQGKHYRNSAEEDERRNLWADRLSLVNSHNLKALSSKAGHSFTLGLNEFADWLPTEYNKLLGFRSHHLTSPPSRKKRQTVYYPTTALSTNLSVMVNWTAKGWVGPIQNQGQCGSCWSFAACGAIESQYYNVTKKYYTLSEQNMVDCSAPQGNQGCEGGNMQNAFRYVLQNKGVDSDAYYPFTGKTGTTCRYVANHSVTYLRAWKNVQSQSEIALQQAVALVGPVAAGIDASGTSFQLYRSGVYSSSTCSNAPQNLNHAVLVVGYGTTSDNLAYWLIKNSWGPSWGMSGYMMLARNSNNMCGIATDATFPTNLVPSPTYTAPPPSAASDTTESASYGTTSTAVVSASSTTSTPRQSRVAGKSGAAPTAAGAIATSVIIFVMSFV